MNAPVDLSILGGVATITLNRPERMNAFDAAMHGALGESLSRIEGAPDVGALLLTGAGRAFCAGQDLSERASAFGRGETVDLGLSLAEHYSPLIRRLAALSCPVIAAVNGVASGAGAALAIACDVVVAAESARFQFGFVRVGLAPDAGSTWSLARRVGDGRALALALTGEAIDSQRALAIGLCDRLVADDALVDETTALARAFADGPRGALRAIKHTLRCELPDSLEAALTAEASTQRTLGFHRDYREAVVAFAEKRAPQFTRETQS